MIKQQLLLEVYCDCVGFMHTAALCSKMHTGEANNGMIPKKQNLS